MTSNQNIPNVSSASTVAALTRRLPRLRGLRRPKHPRPEERSRRSAVLLEHVVAFRKRRSGSTKSHSDSSRSGFDFTKRSSYFDEPSAERGNCLSSKRKRRVVFQE